MQLSQFKNVLAVLDYFKDEATCKAHLEQLRWNGKVTCPHCGHEKVYRTNRGFKCADKDCHKKFSVTSGTIYENTKIKLRYWFAAIYKISSEKKGVSSCQLARDLGICQKTAWFLNHRIRQMMVVNAPEKLKGVVEVDETFVGGKASNMHKSRFKKKKHLILENKTIVVGAVSREGMIIIQPLKDRKTPSLREFVNKHIEPQSTLITDEYKSYKPIGKSFNHLVIQHRLGEYKNGIAHTNTIEGFWSILKRGIIGIYHYVSAKHLARYCHEFSYRYNSRKISDTERFMITMKNIHGRLKYEDLIAA